MKKLILAAGIAALLTFTTAGSAAPLNTNGIPAAAQGLIHLDYDLVKKSAIGTEYIASLKSQKKGSEDFINTLKDDLGLDLEKDAISDITLGLTAPAAADVDPDVIVIVRGKFSPEKFLSAGKKKNAKFVAVGKHSFANVGTHDKKWLVGVVDGKTLIAVNKSAALATAAVDAHTGAAKSFAAPAPLVSFGKQFGNPAILIYADGRLFPPADNQGGVSVPPPDSLYAALGDNGTNIRLRTTAAYPTAEKAQQAQATLQGLAGIIQSMSAQGNGAGGKQDPKSAARLNKLFSAMKFTTADKFFLFAVDYPVADAVQALKAQSAGKAK
ncbi:MAG: hypothetical protein LBV54_02530 [Puniceicoccales bacterium]|jgi:hypothetical protein|nr:hypothetical protein [Puniceicoccales bacterium]